MRAARLDSPWITALFGVAVAIVTWPFTAVHPGAGLDNSWILGLNMAAAEGLDHGTQVVYTYGPLGYLDVPLVIDGTLAVTGAIYLVAMRATLAASLLFAARRSLPWPAAAFVAFVAAEALPRDLVPLSLATVWCLIALQSGPPRWIGSLVAVGGGALAGLEVMVKLNIGLTTLALVVVTALALPERRRTLLTMAAAFVATFAIGWFASGQGIGNVDDYVRASFEIVSGYSEALQRDVAEVPWDGAAALALAVGTIAAAFLLPADLPTRRRVLICAVVAVLALALAKFSFVRHDAGHVGAIFGGLCAVLVALRWRGAARFVLPVVVVAAAAAFMAASATWQSQGVWRADEAADQLEPLLDPAERGDTRDAQRAAMARFYSVDPEILERIGDAPVDARPWEIGLIWAYDLNWRPLPVLQDYQAYTPWLDRLDAETLASEDGPEFILRHYGFDEPFIGLEGRFEPFNSPLVTRTLLCNFRQTLPALGYQLLERSEDRCGAERPLGSTSAAYGEPVAVPEAMPNEAVFAAIEGARASGIERLRTLLYRAAVRTIALDDTPAFLPPRNAEHGLLLTAPEDSGYDSPWVLAYNPREIAITSAGGLATSEPTLDIRFFAVPLD